MDINGVNYSNLVENACLKEAGLLQSSGEKPNLKKELCALFYVQDERDSAIAGCNG